MSRDPMERVSFADCRRSWQESTLRIAGGSSCRAMTWIGWLIALASTANLMAQATCTATVIQPLIVSATGGGTHTRTVGAIPVSGATVVSQSYGVLASAYAGAWTSAQLPSGAVGWRIVCEVQMDLTSQFGINVAESVSGRVRLHFQSQAPVHGFLHCGPEHFFLPLQSYSGDLFLDLNADGVPDFGAIGQDWRPTGLPMTLDAVGWDVILDLNMIASWQLIGAGTAHGDAAGIWDVVFLPNTYGLEMSQTGCIPVDLGRDPFGSWRMQVAAHVPSQLAPPIVAAIFLIGLAETNNPLPTQPFCSLLVDNPAIVLPSMWGANVLSLTLPDLWVPPGLHFYLQGAWLDAQNQVFTTDSVRTM